MKDSKSNAGSRSQSLLSHLNNISPNLTLMNLNLNANNVIENSKSNDNNTIPSSSTQLHGANSSQMDLSKPTILDRVDNHLDLMGAMQYGPTLRLNVETVKTQRKIMNKMRIIREKLDDIVDIRSLKQYIKWKKQYQNIQNQKKNGKNIHGKNKQKSGTNTLKEVAIDSNIKIEITTNK